MFGSNETKILNTNLNNLFKNLNAQAEDNKELSKKIEKLTKTVSKLIDNENKKHKLEKKKSEIIGSVPEDYYDYIYLTKEYFTQHHMMRKREIPNRMYALESDEPLKNIKLTLYQTFFDALVKNNIDIGTLLINEEHSPYPTVCTTEIKVISESYDWSFYSESTKAVIEITFKDKSTMQLDLHLYGFPEAKELIKDFNGVSTFFNLLKEVFNKFDYETTFGFDMPEVKDGNTYPIVINELAKYINKAFEKTNIDYNFSYGKKGLQKYDLKDSEWSITRKKFFIMDDEEYKKKLKAFIEEHKQSNTLDSQYINAINEFYELGDFEDEDDFDFYQFSAVEKLKKLANNENHAFSMLFLAAIHADGKYALRDIEVAKEYLRKAYQLGMRKQSIKIWTDLKFD